MGPFFFQMTLKLNYNLSENIGDCLDVQLFAC